MFARMGFTTAAIDMSEQGLSALRGNAEAEGLRIITRTASMTELPFDSGSFDYVLSFNVIYHGDRSVVETAFSEIRRILKPHGTFQATMLSKRNSGFGLGTKVSPGTFVREAGPGDDSDKVHPHFYCSAAELVELLAGFELLSLRDVAQRAAGNMHWQFVAEQLP